MNKNRYCESYFLSKLGSLWTQIKLYNKRCHWSGTLDLSWPLTSCCCVRTDHIPAGTKLNSPPPFPFFESGNLWQQWEFVLSFLLTSEVYCKGRKVILCTWILFSSLLQHLLPHKGDRGFHSQVFKDDKWWMLGVQVWKSGCLPLLSPGVHDQEGWIL